MNRRPVSDYTAGAGAALNNLVSVNWKLGQYERAEAYAHDGLALLRAALPERHPVVGLATMNLGETLRKLNRHPEARELLEQARKTLAVGYGPAHPTVIMVHANLAESYLATGDLKRARRQAVKADQLAARALGDSHPHAAHARGVLADVLAALGDARVVRHRREAAALYNSVADLVLGHGSERQKRAFMTSLTEDTHKTLSLHLRQRPDDVDAGRLALETLAARKGRVLEAWAGIVSGHGEGASALSSLRT
ncbi:MAG: tetratricopeptide repeat protein, partial [Myxococcota bacterium]|nr:tetratricopeptide repeat protein [Myxococcota bacterium]